MSLSKARLTLAVPSVLLLAACGTAAGSDEPNWKPVPSVSNEPNLPRIDPALPTPTGPPSRPQASPNSSSPNSSQPSPQPSSSAAGDPNVVAKRLTAPRGIAVLPDATALVAERTTGRILRVQPTPNQPVETVRTLTGLNVAGGGGLLDLALSPTYGEDHLIYAYITTRTDARVVTFTLQGPMTPVLTGIPIGPSNDTGRLAFDAHGSLYIATGDGGRMDSAPALDRENGSVLRVNDIGQPAQGNPAPGSPVIAGGLVDPAGLCANVPAQQSQTPGQPTPSAPTADPVLVVEAGQSGLSLINEVTAGARITQSPDDALEVLPSAYTYPGDCAIYDDALYVTSLDGENLLRAPLTVTAGGVTVGKWGTVFKPQQYGRLLTVTAGADGSLWLATSNKDGHGKPVPDDERIIRIMATGGGEDSSPA